MRCHRKERADDMRDKKKLGEDKKINKYTYRHRHRYGKKQTETDGDRTLTPTCVSN